MSAPTHNLGGYFEWAAICDICGKHRSTGNHKKCSKLRQAARQKEREAHDEH